MKNIPINMPLQYAVRIFHSNIQSRFSIPNIQSQYSYQYSIPLFHPNIHPQYSIPISIPSYGQVATCPYTKYPKPSSISISNIPSHYSIPLFHSIIPFQYPIPISNPDFPSRFSNPDFPFRRTDRSRPVPTKTKKRINLALSLQIKHFILVYYSLILNPHLIIFNYI